MSTVAMWGARSTVVRDEEEFFDAPKTPASASKTEYELWRELLSERHDRLVSVFSKSAGVEDLVLESPHSLRPRLQALRGRDFKRVNDPRKG